MRTRSSSNNAQKPQGEPRKQEFDSFSVLQHFGALRSNASSRNRGPRICTCERTCGRLKARLRGCFRTPHQGQRCLRTHLSVRELDEIRLEHPNNAFDDLFADLS